MLPVALQAQKLSISPTIGIYIPTLGFRLGGLLSFYVAADDYIYGTRIDETTLEADKKTQNDMPLSLGFGIPLGSR
jgi:hypothetical protein